MNDFKIIYGVSGIIFGAVICGAIDGKEDIRVNFEDVYANGANFNRFIESIDASHDATLAVLFGSAVANYASEIEKPACAGVSTNVRDVNITASNFTFLEITGYAGSHIDFNITEDSNAAWASLPEESQVKVIRDFRDTVIAHYSDVYKKAYSDELAIQYSKGEALAYRVQLNR